MTTDSQRKPRARYRVERTSTGTWVVVDLHISKVRMHNDVVDTFTARAAARTRCVELNKQDRTGEPEQQQLAG